MERALNNCATQPLIIIKGRRICGVTGNIIIIIETYSIRFLFHGNNTRPAIAPSNTGVLEVVKTCTKTIVSLWITFQAMCKVHEHDWLNGLHRHSYNQLTITSKLKCTHMIDDSIIALDLSIVLWSVTVLAFRNFIINLNRVFCLQLHFFTVRLFFTKLSSAISLFHCGLPLTRHTTWHIYVIDF